MGLDFIQTVAAVVAANGLTAMFLYGGWHSVQFAKKGVPEDRLPWWVYVCMVVPPLVAAAGIYTLS